jgi:hypothetical protein
MNKVQLQNDSKKISDSLRVDEAQQKISKRAAEVSAESNDSDVDLSM